MYRRTPKYMTFRAKLRAENKKVPLESNPIPYPEYLHLPVSLSFATATDPNNQFSKVNS